VHRKLEVYIDSVSELARLLLSSFRGAQLLVCFLCLWFFLLFQELEEVGGIEELEKEISRRIKRGEAVKPRS
jgi:hypothetical protein